MIPFPGESVLIEDAVDLTSGEDYTLLSSIVRRAETRPFNAGMVWRAWAYPGDATYLEESGLTCDVSWVVEVAAGTVTLTAGELLDPTYSDITTPTSTPLGTYTVTGPDTLVIPSTVTADQVLSGSDAFMLELVCDSGVSTVQQVKLRVWPEGGALGGWSAPKSEWSTEPELPAAYEAPVVVAVNEIAATQEDSWDLTMNQAVAAWGSEKVGPHNFTSVDDTLGYLAPFRGGSLRAIHASGDGGITYGTPTDLLGAILVVVGADWRTAGAIDPALTDGVDYIRPPTEVRGEAGAYMAQQIGDGTTGWVNTAAYVTTSAEATPVPAPTIDVGSTDDLTITPLGGGLYEIDLDGAAGSELTTPDPEGSFSESVPLPDDAQFIIVKLAHTAATIAPEWPAPPALAGAAVGVVGFGTNPIDLDFHPLMTFATLPAYRVWMPVVTTKHPHLIFDRSDGLGAGAGFVFGRDTRQSSGLVFGNT